jgi:hypothetical protein
MNWSVIVRDAYFASVGFSLCFGVWASILWWRASRVERNVGIEPHWMSGFEARQFLIKDVPRTDWETREWFDVRSKQIQIQQNYLMESLQSQDFSAFLNKRAAVWTGVSVIVNTISALLGQFNP